VPLDGVLDLDVVVAEEDVPLDVVGRGVGGGLDALALLAHADSFPRVRGAGIFAARARARKRALRPAAAAVESALVAEDRIELLRRVPLFSDVEERDLEAVANTLREVNFDAGQEVTTEGGGGVGFFVIQEGEATVTVHGIERGRLGPGDYFGEVALIARTDRTATITAATPLRCLGMTSWDFRPIVETNGSIAWKLMQALARKLQDAESRSP
jgi:hypothetical protein